MVDLTYPPAIALYTAEPPYRNVESYSQLLRDLKHNTAFIVCGSEGIPKEISQIEHDASRMVPKQSYLQQFRANKQKHMSPPIDRWEDVEMSMTEVTPQPYNYEYETIRAEINGEEREFYCPKRLKDKQDLSKPAKRLKLDWVYGLNAFSRNPLHVLSTGELVYYVSNIAVVYDKKKDTQRFFTAHTSPICCIALHPDNLQPYIASGQSLEPLVRIWDARSMATYSVVGEGILQGNVTSLQLSSSGLLLIVDSSDKHTLLIWDWQNNELLVRTMISGEIAAVSAIFHPHDPSLVVTYGRQHVHFWKLFSDEENTYRLLRDKESGIFSNEFASPPSNVTAISFSPNGEVITADSEGRLLIWSKNDSDVYSINEEISKDLLRAHSPKPITALFMSADGTLLSSAGNEIRAWDSSAGYNMVKERLIPEAAGPIRSIVTRVQGSMDGAIFVVTAKSCLLEGSLQDKLSFVLHGHHNPVTSIVSSPSELSFFTAGQDSFICKWSADDKKMIWKVHVEFPCSSLAIDPTGRVLSVGTGQGRLIILSTDSGEHLSSFQVSHDHLDSMAFSPDGNRLALACHNASVYVFDVLDDAVVYRRRARKGILDGHEAAVFNLDWSTNSRYIQTESKDFEVIFWDTDQMLSVDPQSIVENEWVKHRCTIGARVIGAWKKLMPDVNVSAANTSNDKKLLITGNSDGSLRLYKYPCSSKKANFDERRPYSESIRAIEFSSNDQYVFTIGGRDCGTLQWVLSDSLEYT
ncbi:DgyrCDS4453 [Dimorphilus gyrociliatus]|uniref:DgyrCDS4453 n=1 Tax=Dimorphilus gyrociliatus TaxID=2664684 RepID=A0A7I8VGQ3_9ANNE|nr:DgyrCDS4453 [Dimorphilus gyrociliatus]